jgi:hypothetical protein
VIVYVAYAQKQEYERVVVSRPGSDIIFFLLQYACTFEITILFGTGSGDKHCLLNITDIADDLGEGSTRFIHIYRR